MEKQKKSVRVKFRAIVLSIIGILLCAAPCGAQFVGVGETAKIDYAIEDDFLLVLGTANLYPGAYLGWGIYAATGSTVNIYGGQIGNGFAIVLYTGEPSSVVTVYGTNFALDKVPLDPSVSEVSIDRFTGGVLTGTYGNGDPIYLKFYSNAPIHLQPPDMGIAIDIKPGNDQNNINLKSRGVVPVAVLTTDDFDAATIDPDTVKFAGAEPVRCKLVDVDEDGDADMMFHFKTQQLNLDRSSTEATLTAQLKSQMTIQSTRQISGGTIVSGTDKVKIIQSEKKE